MIVINLQINFQFPSDCIYHLLKYRTYGITSAEVRPLHLVKLFNHHSDKNQFIGLDGIQNKTC